MTIKKYIDLEAHFFTKEYAEYLYTREKVPKFEVVENEKKEKFTHITYGPGLTYSHISTFEDLLDLGEKRLSQMDKAGIDIQVLTLSNPCPDMFDASEGTVMARKVNDELSQVVKRYPDRFIGLAAIAPQNPGAAARELERAVKELNLKGVKINSNVNGEYLDDQKYWVIFEIAEKLGVPIYLHPKLPPADVMRVYGDYGLELGGPSWGFGSDTGLHVMRLIYSGVFDKYPRLKIILGHLGEAFPFWLNRIDFSWLRKPKGGTGKGGPKNVKRPSDYIKDNFIITISGMFFQPAFMCAYLALGADRITFAVDYPYEKNEEAIEFIEGTSICENDKEKICHLNAEKLFRLS